MHYSDRSRGGLFDAFGMHISGFARHAMAGISGAADKLSPARERLLATLDTSAPWHAPHTMARISGVPHINYHGIAWSIVWRMRSWHVRCTTIVTQGIPYTFRQREPYKWFRVLCLVSIVRNEHYVRGTHELGGDKY